MANKRSTALNALSSLPTFILSKPGAKTAHFKCCWQHIIGIHTEIKHWSSKTKTSSQIQGHGIISRANGYSLVVHQSVIGITITKRIQLRVCHIKCHDWCVINVFTYFYQRTVIGITNCTGLRHGRREIIWCRTWSHFQFWRKIDLTGLKYNFGLNIDQLL